MKPTKQFSRNMKFFALGAMAAVLFFSLAFPVHSLAASEDSTLKAFVERVKNGHAEQLRGMYAPGVTAATVTQQPENDPRFISNEANVATQFSMATKLGNVGLLAHNTLAGAQFFKMTVGGTITLVYGDGRTENFVIVEIASYQVLDKGNYLNLATNQTEKVGDVFMKAYAGAYHLTLQTCIAKDGNNEWGRMFIIAQPVK
ncbi:MAG: hypothetical protein Fur002_01820 [Anaerolineales bacterium]